MSIKVNILNTPGFVYANRKPSKSSSATSIASSQNQKFKKLELQNGYGTATTVSVSPGFGHTVDAEIKIVVNSISEQIFQQVIDEVKKSKSYQNNSSFRKEVDSSSYSNAGSSSSGIFGWLVGGGSNSYKNNSSNLTESINKFNSGDSSDDLTVANTISDIMVKNESKVNVTASVSVTGQLLVPSPTIIAVESTVFSFTTEEGTESSVTLLNQSPLIPVDTNNGTVSQNTIPAGTALNISPIGG